MSRLLLVEDDELVGTLVSLNLEGDGHQVEWCKDGLSAWSAVRVAPYDLALVDIALPGIDGQELLVRMRQTGIGTPVLMLTARADTASKVRALDAGADDYITKPFEFPELVARVRALVRRSCAEREVPASRIVVFDRYRVDLETRSAQSNDGPILLGEKETAILAALVRADGAVLSRAAIIERVWGGQADPGERTVDNYIVRLRRAFEVDPTEPRHILTVRGAGFRFVP